MQFLKVLADRKELGWASGTAYSPTLRRMISLARLDRALEPGAEVEVLWGGFSDEPTTRIRATVCVLPFIAQHRAKQLA